MHREVWAKFCLSNAESTDSDGQVNQEHQRIQLSPQGLDQMQSLPLAFLVSQHMSASESQGTSVISLLVYLSLIFL